MIDRRDGHVSYWPPFYDRRPRRRSAAVLTESKRRIVLVDRDGAVLPVSSHADVVNLAAGRTDVYVGDLNDSERGYPFLHEALNDEHSTISVSRGGRIAGIICRGAGRSTASISSSVNWGAESTLDANEFLDALGDAFLCLGLGEYPTPSGLGQALMREHHRRGEWKKISRPNAACRSVLLETSIGGRVDTPALGATIERAYEEDMRNAYCASARLPLPIGTAVAVDAPDDPARLGIFATWYGRYQTFLPGPIRFSPALVRLPNGILRQVADEGWAGSGRGPNDPPIWLWREEAEAFERAGGVAIFSGGWAWSQTAPVLRDWAEDIHAKRNEVDGLARDFIKAAIVASIGRFGMRPESYHLVHESRATADARPAVAIDGAGALSDWSIETEPDPNSPALSHWFSYILAQNRLALYRRMIEHDASGNGVLWTNYDAILLSRPSSLPLDPDRLGGWRQTELSNVSIPAPRWLVSDQKIRTPGQSR